jgi:lipopolysaccharide export system permease protein
VRPGPRTRKPQAKPLKILTKYILKEHFAPLMFALSALTSLLLLNYVAKNFGQLVGKGLAWPVIAEFLLLSVPFTVAVTLPMAVLVSTLHAFSRMASENEITAFKASGIAIQKLMVPVFISAVAFTVFMVWFNDQVLPAANHRLTTLSNDIARKKPTFALKEQVINVVSPGAVYLRTARLFENNRMRDVAIYNMSDPQTRTTIRADSGLLELLPNQRDLLLTLFHGSWTVLQPENPTQLRRVFFDTDFLKVRNIANTLEIDTVGGEKSDREMTVCELQRRVVRLVRARDSVFRAMKAIDSGVAKSVKIGNSSDGLGNLYCHRLSGMKIIRTASAATLPPQANQQPAPGYKPPPMPPEQSTPGMRAAQAEQLKLQIGLAQATINGDRVEIEKKFAIAAACVIFALLGAPIALRFPRGGVGLTIGVSLGVFAFYYVGLNAGEALARANIIPPFWAMWSSNLLLLFVGIVLTSRLGREGSTSRGSEASEFFTKIREWFTRRGSTA